MKYNIKWLVKWVVAGVFVLVGITALNVNNVMADGYGLTLSPMNQKIIIDPGDSYKASFKISNPSSSTEDTYYKIEIDPYYKTENGEITYSAEGDYSEIVKWVTFDVPTEDKLEPNEIKEVVFTIDVPENAPAGGQYMAIKITAGNKSIGEEEGQEQPGDDANATIKETKRMAHIVYAEITGDTIKKGEIPDIKVPSFLLSGNVSGLATVRNIGNVHGEAKYTLKIYPLFSDEEVYTNEENPMTATILPDREHFAEVAWEDTPAVGIFNVVFTVEFEGAVAQVSKMVIVCPIWLLFIILAVIAGLIIWIVMRVKAKGSKKAE